MNRTLKRIDRRKAAMRERIRMESEEVRSLHIQLKDVKEEKQSLKEKIRKVAEERGGGYAEAAAQITALMRALKGYIAAWRGVDDKLTTIDDLHEMVLSLSDKLAGTGFILNHLIEELGPLSIEHQGVLNFVCGVLREESEKINTSWPYDVRSRLEIVLDPKNEADE